MYHYKGYLIIFNEVSQDWTLYWSERVTLHHVLSLTVARTVIDLMD